MATPPSAKTELDYKTALDYQRSINRINGVVTVVKQLIKWGAIVLLGRYAYLSVASLAGRLTLADIVVSFLANVTLSDKLKDALVVIFILYGLAERALRRKNIKRLAGKITELENLLDPNRTSSNLTIRGTTRPGDQR